MHKSPDDIPAHGSSILMLNGESDFAKSVGASLERVGYQLRYPGLAQADAPSRGPSNAILFPWRATHEPLQHVEVEGLVSGLETMLATAGQHVRKSGLQPHSASLRRIVIVSGWEANGGVHRTSMAASCGALLGLARSWALEFAPLGITVNAIVPGPDFMDGQYKTPSLGRAGMDDLAYAISFFLDPKAKAISGQVLSVCAGRSPATIPI